HPLQLSMFELLPARRLLGIEVRRTTGLFSPRTVDEELPRRDIAVMPEQRGRRGAAVPPGASDLLVIRLDRTWNRVVNDGVDVRPIDAHPDRVRGADDRQRSRGKRILHARALVVLEPGMIWRRLDARSTDTGRGRFSGLPRCRVDERATSAHQTREPI